MLICILKEETPRLQMAPVLPIWVPLRELCSLVAVTT